MAKMGLRAFACCYFVLMLFAYILMLPILCFFSAFKPKYRHSIPARFFLWKNHFKHFGDFESANFTPEVWIHACSLGEINSLQAILSESQKNLLITTTTNTGFKRANEIFLKHPSVAIRYLPFEIFIPFIMPKNLKKLIVLEAELWFMLFFCAKKRGAHTALLNARISTKSYPKYKKNAWFYRRLFSCVDSVLCQQDADRERLSELGAQNIEPIGNIKALIKPNITKNLPRFEIESPQKAKTKSTKNTKDSRKLHESMAVSKDTHTKKSTLIVAASTHKGEEELILRAFKAHFMDSPFHRLIIAPRHPERFGEVWEIIKAHNISAIKYSENGASYESSVILLDVLGELINVYAIADCVILGGSFVKKGGHNPLECAHFGVKLITGEHIFNQFALFELIKNYKIVKNDEFIVVLGDLANLPKSKIKDSAINAMQRKISEIFAN